MAKDLGRTDTGPATVTRYRDTSINKLGDSTAAMDLSARLNRPYIGPNGGAVYAELDVEPAEAPGQGGSSDRHLAFCIDVSTSMEGDPLAAAKEGAVSVLGQLNPEDYLSVVAFSSEAEVVVEPVQWRETNAERIENKIAELQPQAATNIEDGLRTAKRTIDGLGGGETVARRILLLSDGRPNRGITDVDGFGTLATEFSRDGFSIISAGFGAEYDEDIVRVLGEASQGEWDHIMRPNQIKQFFNDTVFEAGEVTLANPRLELDLGSIEISEVYRRMPQIQQVDVDWQDGTASILLPDVQRGRKQEVVFTFDVPSGDVGQSTDLASVRLMSGGAEVASDTLSVTYTDNPAQYGEEESVRAKFVHAKGFQAGVKGDTQVASQLFEDLEATFADPKAKAILQRGGTSVSKMADADTENERRSVAANESRTGEAQDGFIIS